MRLKFITITVNGELWDFDKKTGDKTGCVDLNDVELAQSYDEMCQLLNDWNQIYHLHMDTLSMGMSGDFQQAILHGSTMVRIGQALFGARKQQ